jgi:hypothetical protein
VFVELGGLRRESFGRVGQFVEFVVLVVIWFFVVVWFFVLVVFRFVLGIVHGQRDFVGLPGRRDARVDLLDRDSLRGRAGVDDGFERSRDDRRGHPERSAAPLADSRLFG